MQRSSIFNCCVRFPEGMHPTNRVTWYPGPNVQAKEGSDRAKEAKELAAQMNKTQVDADARFGLQSGCFSLTASKVKW